MEIISVNAFDIVDTTASHSSCWQSQFERASYTSREKEALALSADVILSDCSSLLVSKRVADEVEVIWR